MPMNLARSDRHLLLWSAAIMLPLIIASALLTGSEQESQVPSTYSSDPGGAKAAYLLLQEQGLAVERWEQSPTLLPIDADRTVLVLASPFTAPSKEEKTALQLYLSRGGRILLTGSTPSLFLPKARTEREWAPSPEGNDYQPQLLTRITHGGAIHMSPGSYWASTSTSYLVHYADHDRPIVVSYDAGSGRMIWWASAGPLTNRGIMAAGNLDLLLNSLGDSRSRILWDEYFHGSRQSLAAYIAEPPLGFGLLQCALLVAALLLTYSRRTLPIHPAEEKSRLSPLEFVETLGGLYRRAGASHAALEVPYGRFRSTTIRHLGLAPSTSSNQLAEALRNRFGYKDDSLADLLRRIDAALAQGEPSEDSALALTQELNLHMQNLKFVQENSIHADRVTGAQARTK
jgi:Domain of unknown function (DUF4350)